MFFQNLHAHTTYDDGKATPREMIAASMEAGLRSIGISLHAPTRHDGRWEGHEARIRSYLAEMSALREEFAGRMEVFSGVEWDILSPIDLSPFEYAIGSVHYLPSPPEQPAPCVDFSLSVTQQVLAQEYGGDADAFVEAYFAQYDAVAAQPKVKIVGHLDLPTKFDEQTQVFDPDSPRYRNAILAAMEKLVAADKIFEINTGAISRGYRTTPYPDERWLRALREMGGKITISADAHAVSAVACAYEQAEALARRCGFRQWYALVRTQSGVQFEAFDLPSNS